eukprot:CAMPEP_0203906656 /NCGR_PEP_ID=MMETSP0359-20131031/48247_1 /ASSEMBLY_ACC=CAM_ASM_000338 /TAXON_ID=268821 /ORGANISM="Scrippsiella Hangoei, Strain SHTV-5" /LENGTH=116 /DNA_ID=CAMNT_0050831331 /DNA_START=501 /DNA_END=852 /DNA_ORIENTATION=+
MRHASPNPPQLCNTPIVTAEKLRVPSQAHVPSDHRSRAHAQTVHGTLFDDSIPNLLRGRIPDDIQCVNEIDPSARPMSMASAQRCARSPMSAFNINVGQLSAPSGHHDATKSAFFD